MNTNFLAQDSVNSQDENKGSLNPGAVQTLVYRIEDQRYGLPLSVVDRIVRAVALTRLQGASLNILGVINAQGLIIPVLNLRKILRVPERNLVPSDILIFARLSGRPVALPADSVVGVLECSTDKIIDRDEIASGIENLAGVVKLPDGLILIQELDRFFPHEEW